MSNLPAYRGILDSLWHTPAFKRYIQMLEAEPTDYARLSGIEEWRKQTIGRLKQTLAPKAQNVNLKTYRENLEWEKSRSEFDKTKGQ